MWFVVALLSPFRQTPGQGMTASFHVLSNSLLNNHSIIIYRYIILVIESAETKNNSRNIFVEFDLAMLI
jgi:hypothetical protein